MEPLSHSQVPQEVEPISVSVSDQNRDISPTDLIPPPVWDPSSSATPSTDVVRVKNSLPGRTFYAPNIEAIEALRKQHEVKNNVQFVAQHTEKGFATTTLEDLRCTMREKNKCTQLVWSDRNAKVARPPIPTTDSPFLIVGRNAYDCFYGPDRKNKKKADNKKAMDAAGQTYQRQLIQDSNKLGCEAYIGVRHIIVFSDYKASNDTQQRKAMSTLKTALLGNDNIHHEHWFFIYLPSKEEHSDHIKGHLSGHNFRLDPALNKHLTKQVKSGKVTVSNLKEHARVHVEDVLFKDETPPPLTNRAFYPKHKTMLNLAYRANRFLSSTRGDIDRLENDLTSWENKHPDRNYYLERKINKCDLPHLLVFQTEQQAYLMRKYAKEVVLMDSTYNTQRYAMSLYFLVVPTNTHFMVIATFFTENDETHSIQEALQIIKMWNPNFNPEYFMTDSSASELKAVILEFKGTKRRLCKWHFKKSWKENVHKSSNKVSPANAQKVLDLMEAIADAPTLDLMNAAIDQLKSSPLCSPEILSYFDWWLTEERLKMWCSAYDGDFHRRVKTTGGVERKNGILKGKYLDGVSTSNMCNIVRVLLSKMFQDSFISYLEENVTSLSQSKKYSSHVPYFLHDRPTAFVSHVMDNCGQLDTSFEKKEVCVAPPCLMLHINRFTLDGRKDVRKLYCPDRGLPLPLPDGSVKYDLFAVVNHVGNTVQSGHYTAYVRKQEEWFTCSDENVAPLPTNMEIVTAKSYMLFYRKASALPLISLSCKPLPHDKPKEEHHQNITLQKATEGSSSPSSSEDEGHPPSKRLWNRPPLTQDQLNEIDDEIRRGSSSYVIPWLPCDVSKPVPGPTDFSSVCPGMIEDEDLEYERLDPELVTIDYVEKEAPSVVDHLYSIMTNSQNSAFIFHRTFLDEPEKDRFHRIHFAGLGYVSPCALTYVMEFILKVFFEQRPCANVYATRPYLFKLLIGTDHIHKVIQYHAGASHKHELYRRVLILEALTYLLTKKFKFSYNTASVKIRDSMRKPERKQSYL